MKVMNTEDILKPRYKVIADYPRSPYVIGNIISDDDKEYTCEYMSRFPAIFKPLEWWEDREESDMPKYVKSPNGNAVYRLDGEIEGMRGIYFMISPKTNYIHEYPINGTLPATEEEYNQQSK
jgi:hypothetical protein